MMNRTIALHRDLILKVVLSLALFVALPPFVNAQFSSRLASSGAAEQLRLGVQAYHRGRYAEALLLFEKALAYAPAEPLSRFWLGRAYYKSGYSATALRAWEPLVSLPGAPPELASRVESIRAVRGLGPGYAEPRYVEVVRFEGKTGRETRFLRPAALLPTRDGGVLVAAHGSNEIVKLDPNGVVVERNSGGLAGFDRPFGLAELPDGTLFVAEFNGDRVRRIGGSGGLTFGSKGRGDGQLLGPQYAACDDAGYLYVSDYGNARVVKFDPDGTFILAFGGKTQGFPGLASPTGIAVADGLVYVADSYRRAIYRFDSSGNYLGVLAEGELRFPEGLSRWEGRRALLVADTDRVLLLDLENEALTELYRSPDRKARIVGASADRNGNLLICDFDASTVSVLSELPGIAAGYDVEIERIDAGAFPRVVVDLSVRDRSGRPVVGLKQGNFHLSERVRRSTQIDEGGKVVVRTEEFLVPVSDLSLSGTGTSTRGFRAIILAERSADMLASREPARGFVSELARALAASGIEPYELGLVSAGAIPAVELPLKEGAPDLAAYLRALTTGSQSGGRFDLGLKLAATSLLPAQVRDAVIYVGGGRIDEASFQGTTLSELARLLEVNGIRFYAVLLGTDAPSSVISYLVERTGGSVYAVSRPRGLGDFVAELGSAPSGRYRLGFVSKADPEFGQAYLSVAAEAYLYKKSGRDELGYYAPLR